MGDYQSGPLNLVDNVGHGKGFSGTGHTQKNLITIFFLQTGYQLFDGLRLISRWFKVGF